MVGATGFEPATSCSRSRRSTGLSYAPPKARAAFITAARARPEGLEPTTPRSVVWCSIQLSYGRFTDEAGVGTPHHPETDKPIPPGTQDQDTMASSLARAEAVNSRPAERNRARRAMGGTRLELVTSTMSTWRSNQLS
jgi:hypothetical protein